MPTLPQPHRAIPQREQERTWASRQHAGRAWYNSKRWRGRRAQQLTEQPLCEECLRQNVVTAATDADHLIPHRWSEESFWNGQLQSLCHECHSVKTRREQQAATGQRRYVICGLPGSGKTTWMREHAKPGDITWDVDAIATAVFGLPTWPRPHDVGRALWVMRNALLRNADQISGDVYVVVTDAENAAALARDLGAEVVTMECSDEERSRRLRERDERKMSTREA